MDILYHSSKIPAHINRTLKMVEFQGSISLENLPSPDFYL